MRTPQLGILGMAGLLALVLAFSGCGRGGRSSSSTPRVGTPQIFIDDLLAQGFTLVP